MGIVRWIVRSTNLQEEMVKEQVCGKSEVIPAVYKLHSTFSKSFISPPVQWSFRIWFSRKGWTSQFFM